MNGATTMESGRSRDDQIVHERARQIGYASSNCDTCGALGRTDPRIEPSEVDGLASAATCPDCGGSGRWWFPDLRALGSFTAHLTDAELRVLLRAAAPKGVLHGNQG